jgi:hypothetical protein
MLISYMTTLIILKKLNFKIKLSDKKKVYQIQTSNKYLAKSDKIQYAST